MNSGKISFGTLTITPEDALILSALTNPSSNAGLQGKIVFACYIQQIDQICLMNGDGSGCRPESVSDEVKKNLRRKVHQTLKRVTQDYENFEFNTVVSSLMELMNQMYKARSRCGGLPRVERIAGNLCEDAGSCGTAYLRRTMDELFG